MPPSVTEAPAIVMSKRPAPVGGVDGDVGDVGDDGGELDPQPTQSAASIHAASSDSRRVNSVADDGRMCQEEGRSKRRAADVDGSRMVERRRIQANGKRRQTRHFRGQFVGPDRLFEIALESRLLRLLAVVRRGERGKGCCRKTR